MNNFKIKISRGSSILKEISCNDESADIKSTMKSVKFLKKASEEFMKDLVAKEKLSNSSTTTKSSKSDEDEDEDEDLMGADDNEEEDEFNPPELKKTKLS